MKNLLNNKNPITLLILSSIAMPIAFSTWMVLLNNFSVERASFTGVENWNTSKYQRDTWLPSIYYYFFTVLF